MTDNNNTPLVTVAMVTYNSEKYVRMAIESVLASSYTNFELIISDDCSTDNTWEIIQEYKDSRIVAQRNKLNIGEYNNRHKSIDLANGEFLIFIDGDDYIYPWGLEFIINQIKDFPSAGMALAMQWRNYVIYPYLISPRENILFTYFGQSFLNNSFAQTLFRTKKIKEALPFPEKVKSGDTYIKKRIAISNDVLLVCGPISWWRHTPGQASSLLTKGNEWIFDSWKIDSFILGQANCPLDENEKAEIINDKLHIIKKTLLKDLLKLELRNIAKLVKVAPMKDILFSKRKKTPHYSAGASSTNPLMIK